MVKCEICKNKVEETFLEKVNGTYINKKPVCSDCQKKHSFSELKEKLK
ncbi:hypothetical protein J4409_00535 [Candidatus Woesearchaeota archaeon]|nr:hypothetical protein [Candidatus Woesearchaeota archaeon]